MEIEGKQQKTASFLQSVWVAYTVNHSEWGIKIARRKLIINQLHDIYDEMYLFIFYTIKQQ